MQRGNASKAEAHTWSGGSIQVEFSVGSNDLLTSATDISVELLDEEPANSVEEQADQSGTYASLTGGSELLTQELDSLLVEFDETEEPEELEAAEETEEEACEEIAAEAAEEALEQGHQPALDRSSLIAEDEEPEAKATDPEEEKTATRASQSSFPEEEATALLPKKLPTRLAKERSKPCLEVSLSVPTAVRVQELSPEDLEEEPETRRAPKKLRSISAVEASEILTTADLEIVDDSQAEPKPVETLLYYCRAGETLPPNVTYAEELPRFASSSKRLAAIELKGPRTPLPTRARRVPPPPPPPRVGPRNRSLPALPARPLRTALNLVPVPPVRLPSFQLLEQARQARQRVPEPRLPKFVLEELEPAPRCRTRPLLPVSVPRMLLRWG